MAAIDGSRSVDQILRGAAGAASKSKPGDLSSSSGSTTRLCSMRHISDDGDILGIRMGDWKVVLMEQRAKQLMCWFEPCVKLRAPKIFNLRSDPFERADKTRTPIGTG